MPKPRKAPQAAYKRRPTGDAATIARKRFYRKSESYLKQAAKATGATAERYRQLARLSLDDALKTYSRSTTQDFSKPIKAIASELGVDLGEERRKIQSRSKEAEEKIRGELIDLKRETPKSARALRSRDIQAEELREEEARAILNSPLGRRIIGSTEDIWRDKATVETAQGVKIDKTKILPALYEHYKVDNLANLLDKLQNIAGENLYKQPDSEVMYESVKLTIAKRVITDNQVTL